MHFFHKWLYHNRKEPEKFLGQKVVKEWPWLRECRVCGKVQEHWSSAVGDSGWTDLSSERKQVFREHFRPEHCFQDPSGLGFDQGGS